MALRHPSRLGTRGPRRTKTLFAVACNALHNAWACSGGRLAPMARPLVASCVVLELRSLRSTGVTRLRRYYEPLRHPKAAEPVPHGMLVGGHTPPPSGASRVALVSCVSVPLPLPRRDQGTRSLVLPTSSARKRWGVLNGGLPQYFGGSAPALNFSRPAQHSLTLRPMRLLPLLQGHRSGASPRPVTRPQRPDCYRGEPTTPRTGLSPAGLTRLRGAQRSQRHRQNSGDSYAP
jgi:hypothetical protein